MIGKLFLTALAAMLVVMGTAGEAAAKTTLKFGTLAPPRSPWGDVFRTWAKAVKQKTKGEVEIEWQWNGTAGPERAVVGKIKSGQMSGAAITAVGLRDINVAVMALQIPGTFNSWAALDKARDRLAGDFQAIAKKEGFHIGGWGDVGVSRVMSKGYAVKVPNDLKGKKAGMVREDIVAPKVYEVIGGVTAVPAAVTEYLPKLTSGGIDTIVTPPLAAEQLQWASRLDHITTKEVAYTIGAVVMSQKALDKMSADQREVLTSTGEMAAKALTKRIRREDDAAYKRLKKKMKVHETTAAESAEWQKVFKKACERLRGAIPPDALKKVGAC